MVGVQCIALFVSPHCRLGNTVGLSFVCVRLILGRGLPQPTGAPQQQRASVVRFPGFGNEYEAC